MPLSNQSIYDAVATILRDPTNAFRQKCIGSILKQAVVIAAESRAIPNHLARRALALQILRGGCAWDAWIQPIATDATVTGAANLNAIGLWTDGQIDTLIGNVWNIVAGIDPSDVP